MLKLHTVYVISLVSQTTSALVLGLLAWVDRRSRWLMPLALACALHAGAVFLMPLWRGTGRWVPQAISAATLVIMLRLVHIGLRTLVSPLHPRSARGYTAALAAMVALVVLARVNSLLCTEATTFCACLVLAWTVQMLWTAPVRELRLPLRATALLFSAIIMHFLARMPFEALAPASPVLLLLRENTMLLFTFMAFSFLAIYAAESRRRLHVESRLDLITGLPNRRDMEESAAYQVKQALRHGWPCALLMIDLDHFKKLNDTWGHEAGDRALLAVGNLLLRESGDTQHSSVARMGGEEFAMLLPECSVSAALALAERLCAGIAGIRLSLGQAEIAFTASIGVSALQAGETTWAEMLRRADVALYRAKREGRNRVTLCTEAAPHTSGEHRRTHRSGPALAHDAAISPRAKERDTAAEIAMASESTG